MSKPSAAVDRGSVESVAVAARGQSTRTVGRMIAYVRSAGAVAAATALAGAIVSGPASGTGGSEHSAGSHPRSAAVTAEAERETTHTLHATVTSKRSASVHLVVRAHHGDRVVRTEQRQVRVVAGRATRVQVTVSTVQRAPRLTMRLVPTRPRPGDRFTVTRVRWTHRFPSVEPTPDPTPEPTPDPAPDPSAPLLSNGCAYSLRGIPGCGAYLGQAYGSNTDPTSLEADLEGGSGCVAPTSAPTRSTARFASPLPTWSPAGSPGSASSCRTRGPT